MKTFKTMLLTLSIFLVTSSNLKVVGQESTASKPKERVVALKLPGMEDVIIKRDIPYLNNSISIRKMDIYYPPKFDFNKKIPAIVFISGASDSSMVKLVSSPFRKYSQYTSWCKLVAASGMAAIVYETFDSKNDLISLTEYLISDQQNLSIERNNIGAFVCSGHTPTAAAYLLNSSSIFNCAVLYYGFFLTQDGENLSTIESMFKQMGFQKPPILPDPTNWKKDVPLLIVRAGQDNVPNLNQSMQSFLNHAIKYNMPITLFNYPNGPHGFEVYTNNETTIQIIENTLEFWKVNLKE